MMLWRILLFQIILITGAFAVLPACQNGASPGLWSEWVITGSQKCSTSCGSCSKLFYTRKCLTTRVGQACIGDSTRLYPCNTQTCLYPAQRTCCIPYVSMLINGSMQCGPLPKDPAASLPASSKPCCPVGGLWTEWTTFARNPEFSKYMRTRECATEDAGCPCTGEGVEYSEKCPCRAITRSTCKTNSNNPSMFRELAVNDNTCTGTFTMDASNDDVPVFCFANEDIDFAPVIRFEFPDIQKTTACSFDRPFNCQARNRSLLYSKLPVSFTCDLETLYWRYDYRGWLVTSYIQLDIKKTT